MKPRVVLIDLSALFHPAWRANENGPLSVAFESTIGGVNRIAGMYPDALVAVCCDGKGNWRKEVSPEYKAQRDKLPDVFYAQFALVKDRLRADGRLLWEFAGFEADDVIATAWKHATDAGHQVTIATHDKDLFQLVRRDVCDVLSLSTWEVRTEDDVAAKFKVVPTQIADFLALAGDSSDGVVGCPGCGPVSAAKLLEKFPTAEAVCTALAGDLVDCVGPSLAGKISMNRESIRLARKLVSLREIEELKFADIYEKREVRQLTDVETPKDEAAQIVSDSAEPTALTAFDPSSTTAHPVPVAVEYERQLEPTHIDGAFKLAKYIFDSRMYERFPTWQSIGTTIIRGRELGLGALTSLDAFHVVEGKPYPLAYLVVSLARKDADCEYLIPVEWDDKHATWETKHRRRSEPQRMTFTYAQAEAAKLPKTGARGPNGWLKNPEDMLVKSCGSKFARRMYSAALGLVSLEEMGEV